MSRLRPGFGGRAAAHDHPDFANVVRVPRFHQDCAAAIVPRDPHHICEVIILPVIRVCRSPAPPVFDHARFHRDLAEAAAALKAMATELPSDCEPAPA